MHRMGDSPSEDDQVGSPAVPGPVTSYTITAEDANDIISQRTRYLDTFDAVNEELWIVFTGMLEPLEAEQIFRKSSPENRNALRQTLRTRGVDVRMAPRYPI
jgi:uroporphyrinogen-III synthase